MPEGLSHFWVRELLGSKRVVVEFRDPHGEESQFAEYGRLDGIGWVPDPRLDDESYELGVGAPTTHSTE